MTALRVKQKLGPYSSFVPRSLHEYLVSISKGDVKVRPAALFVCQHDLSDSILMRAYDTPSYFAGRYAYALMQVEVPAGALRQGAVLFADASGFTRLTKKLAEMVGCRVHLWQKCS